MKPADVGFAILLLAKRAQASTKTVLPRIA
jgi:hypothetical protein